MISETILDNILVHQKDGILSLVNNKEYDKAILALETVLELWESVPYTYKIKETVIRIDLEMVADYNVPGLHWKRMEKIENQRKALRAKFPSYI